MTIIYVNDKIQTNYSYELVELQGENFNSDFRPQLTPTEMLTLGVFGGKYLTDCQEEFPHAWFTNAKLSSLKKDTELNYYRVDASQPLAVWRKKGLDLSMRPQRVVSMVLSILHGKTYCGRRSKTN